jgi:hypothetical protein
VCDEDEKGELSIKLSANRDSQQNGIAFRVDFFLFILSDSSHSRSFSKLRLLVKNVICVNLVTKSAIKKIPTVAREKSKVRMLKIILDIILLNIVNFSLLGCQVCKKVKKCYRYVLLSATF